MQTGHVIRVNRILSVAALVWIVLATGPLAGGELSPPAQAPPTDQTSTPFAGEWDVVTERGDRFRLTVEQNGNAVAGTVPFGSDRLQINGIIGAGETLTLIWQIGNLAGTGELALSKDGGRLDGQLRSDGGPVEGGTWTGTRPGARPVALPPTSETAEIEPPRQETMPASTSRVAPTDFQTATVASVVSIRDKPKSEAGSKVIGTLAAGQIVRVRCPSRFWCELSEGSGWVSASFLRLGTSAPPATGSIERPKANLESADMPAASDSETGAPEGGGSKLERMIESLFRKKPR